jgi:hypothetical protein
VPDAPLSPQLQAVADEFRFATARLYALRAAVPESRWGVRRDPDRWSVAECVAHLNLTSAAYLGIIGDAIARGRALARPARPRRYRRDPLGWLLWKMMPPPVRFRTRTAAAFVPGAVAPRDEQVAEFDRLQDEQLRLLAQADGLPLGAILVASPFNARVRYNLLSCLSILPPHQHRHLWQAEQVWNDAVP